GQVKGGGAARTLPISRGVGADQRRHDQSKANKGRADQLGSEAEKRSYIGSAHRVSRKVKNLHGGHFNSTMNTSARDSPEVTCPLLLYVQLTKGLQPRSQSISLVNMPHFPSTDIMAIPWCPRALAHVGATLHAVSL